MGQRLRVLLIVSVALGVGMLAVHSARPGGQVLLHSTAVSHVRFVDSTRGEPAPTEAVTVTVEATVTRDPWTRDYTYAYTLTNAPGSRSDVRFFALLSTPWPIRTTAPAHWEHSRFLVAGTDSASVWQVVDSGSIPAGWVDTGNIPPSEFDLEPGRRVRGFSITTPASPIEGGVQFIAQGFDTLPGNAEAGGDEDPGPDLFERGVSGWIAGPGSPRARRTR